MSGAPMGQGPPPPLDGRYHLESLIAEGGMAAVWRARDDTLGRMVAVKVLHDHLAVDGEFVERFRREAIAAAQLTHPHVVGLYDTGRDGRRAWLVMELVEGATLGAVMADAGPLDIAQVADIGEKIARGLAYAHQHGLVHRDVKPANILLGDDGAVKVTDFGIAKSAGAGQDLTGTGTVLGTAAYVAPEQILSEPLDGACDQYALGCVLYEALTGRRPFTGDTAMATAAQRLSVDPPPVCSVRADVPAELGAAVDRALARSPADRFPTADDLAHALAPFVEAGDAFADAPPRRPPAASPPPRRPPAALPPDRARRPDEDRAEHPGSPAAGGAHPGPRAAVGSGAPPPAAAPQASPPRPPEWRRLALPLVAVGALVVALLAAFGSGLLERDGASPDAVAPAAPSALVAPVDVELFDPGGTGSEDREDLDAVLDGSSSTAWQSVGYNTPDFGGLKRGLGVWVDLGAAHRVDAVAVRTDTPGITYEIRVADTPPSDLDGWRRVGGQASAPELSEVTLDPPVISRYLMVWVTGDLQADGSGRFRARLSELAVRGEPA